MRLVYPIPDEVRLEIDELNAYYNRHQITISFLPTQFGIHFMKLENRSLRLLQIGGEKLHNAVNTDYLLYNCYGPTENTVLTTAYLMDNPPDDIPIGAPVDNTKIYIVDRHRYTLQPIGVWG